MRSERFRILARSLAIVTVCAAAACDIRFDESSTAGHVPMARTGAESWIIDGREYRVSSTYFLGLPEGIQFTIDYPYEFSGALAEFTAERALDVALPLIRHAYAEQLHRRARFEKAGSGVAEPYAIGVVLLEKDGPAERGYRVRLTLDEIRTRIAGSPP